MFVRDGYKSVTVKRKGKIKMGKASNRVTMNAESIFTNCLPSETCPLDVRVGGKGEVAVHGENKEERGLEIQKRG